MAEAARDVRKIQKVFLPGQSPEGAHIYSVLVKRTYDIRPGDRCVRAAEDRKLFPADVHFGDPMNSSVRFETDYVPFKLMTDVAFDGKAYAPGGAPAVQAACALSVAGRRKEILVIGDRICRYVDGGRIGATAPAPFESMELKAENAYGGVDIWSDTAVPQAYPRNPLGKGFVVKATPKTLSSLPLPNLEDPRDRISAERLCIQEMKHWARQPLPAGLGWQSKYCHPRMALLGVMPADEKLEAELREANAALLKGKERELYLANPLPRMDFRFFNGAAAGQSFPYLAGDEGVKLENLTPEGVLEFQLPGETLKVRVDMGLGPQEPHAVLHTVQIHGEARQVDLVWRACVPYPGPDWLPEMKNLELEVE
jgi:hypothetical protein